jgi:glutaredoxin 3
LKKKIILFSLVLSSLLTYPSSLISEKIKQQKKGNVEKQKAVNSLVLYVKYNCPYCKSVLNYIKHHKIEITIKDATLQENATYLITKGKKSQVPCLFIDGEPLYESRDILVYLMNNL